MQSRHKLMVSVLAVFLGLLLLGSVAVVVRGFLQFMEVEKTLRESNDALKNLYARNPFPSAENLKVERANLRALEQEMEGLQSALAEKQVEPLGQSPAMFINQFFETQKGLLAKAGAANVMVPKNYDFSFGRHMTGNLPAPQDVPRLTQQLKIVEALCGVLYGARISRLTGVARQEFEVDAVGQAAPRKSPETELKNSVDPLAGVIPAGKLYGQWHFVMKFTGRESSVMNVLNGFAKCHLFVVVTRMSVEGGEKMFERKDVAVAKAGEDAAVKEPPKAKDYRVMCGRDALLDVTLELDVYQFARPKAADATKKPGGA